MNSPMGRKGKAKNPIAAPSSRWRRVLGWLLKLGISVIVFSVLCVICLRWVNPPLTGVMLQRKLEAAAQGQATGLTRQWCSLDQLGAQLPRAVLASEDQRFVAHHGFDFTEIEKALERAQDGGGLRGASTISQQVAKNVFLTTHRSWIRKGLEFWFTALIELFWSKQRILEVHLNVAEWGPRLFGGCAASLHYFGIPASRLSAQQAAQMAVTLPSPLTRRPDRPGPYSIERARWVLGQMPAVKLPE